MMWTEREIREIEDRIFEDLPRVLEQDPRFVTVVEGIVADKFPRRDEFARLLDEVTALRREQREGFERVDQRFERVEKDVDDLRQEQREGFERVDRRFERVEKDVDDLRREQREGFERVDQRFERVEKDVDDLRQEQREGFERVDQRFEQVDQRFEQVDQRFEQVDQRFERVDQRFEQVDQRFEQVDRRFEQMIQRFDDLQSWVQVVVGGMQQRYGEHVEDLIAGTLRLALGWEDVDPDKVRVRQKLLDPEGLIGSPGREYEVDLYAEDTTLYVLEIKSGCYDTEEVENFSDKLILVREHYPDLEIRGILIALDVSSDVQEVCEDLGIRAVT